MAVGSECMSSVQVRGDELWEVSRGNDLHEHLRGSVETLSVRLGHKDGEWR